MSRAFKSWVFRNLQDLQFQIETSGIAGAMRDKLGDIYLTLTSGHVEFKIAALLIIGAVAAIALYFIATAVSRYKKGSLLVGNRYSSEVTVVSREEDPQQFWGLLIIALLGATAVCATLVFMACLVWSLSTVQ